MAEHDYNEVSFFRPHSPHSKDNAKMITFFVILWAVAVFGFQIALQLTNKPTPEPSHGVWSEVWPKIKDGTATEADRVRFADALLMVLGKNVALKAPHKDALRKALSHTAVSLAGADLVNEYAALNVSIREAKFSKTPVPDEVFAELNAKFPQLHAKLVPALRLAEAGKDPVSWNKLKADLLPSAIVAVTGAALPDDVVSALPGIMDLYLVHNSGPLTQARFLGFPFHYWYTAQFLLILFVLICIIYAKMLERINRKYEFVDDPSTGS